MSDDDNNSDKPKVVKPLGSDMALAALFSDAEKKADSNSTLLMNIFQMLLLQEQRTVTAEAQRTEILKKVDAIQEKQTIMETEMNANTTFRQETELGFRIVKWIGWAVGGILFVLLSQIGNFISWYRGGRN